MIEAGSSHCRIVAESLSGGREVDEQTFASLAVLSERLERLKEHSELFAGVSLSPSVRELRMSSSVVTVG